MVQVRYKLGFSGQHGARCAYAALTTLRSKETNTMASKDSTTVSPTLVPNRGTVALKAGDKATTGGIVFRAPYTGDYTAARVGCQWPDFGNPGRAMIVPGEGGIAIITRTTATMKVWPYVTDAIRIAKE